MAYFNFVSDSDLVAAVKTVLDAATKASDKAEKEFEKNVLDPFAALFSITFNQIDLNDWNELEAERQAQKSIQNTIGEFHQHLLGSFNGWDDPGKGGSVDLVNREKKIIAEVKNKHNTMNSSAANDTYGKLANHLKFDRKGYTAYLVQVVPKKAENYNKPWSPNQRTLAIRDDIRVIDGESFYDLASGEEDTLKRIFDVLPKIILDITGKEPVSEKTIQGCKELFKRVYK